MSKSIYEEALEELRCATIDLKDLEIIHSYDVTKIEQALNQAQKQTKLLELYKKLDDFIVAPNGHHVCRYTDDEKYDVIRKQIEELENEKII